MPSRFVDKWNAWRYLAMLGNPRTHVRNIVGNAFFAPVVAAKSLTATSIEAAVSRVSHGKLERTKGAVGLGKADRALLSSAWADYANVQDSALSGGKYSDFANANRYIEEGRVIFRNKALEKARRGGASLRVSPWRRSGEPTAGLWMRRMPGSHTPTTPMRWPNTARPTTSRQNRSPQEKGWTRPGPTPFRRRRRLPTGIPTPCRRRSATCAVTGGRVL